jgi:hypothetical protein
MNILPAQTRFISEALEFVFKYETVWQYIQIPSPMNYMQNYDSPKMICNISKSLLTNNLTEYYANIKPF